MRVTRLTSQILSLTAATAVVVWDLRREGVFALSWGAPLLAALTAGAVARRRRLAGVLSGAAVGASVWFVNYFFRDYTFVTVFSSPNPFMEAIGGGVAGAIVGSTVAAASSLPVPVTVRDWMITVVIMAIVFAGVACYIRSEYAERALIAAVTVFLGVPSLFVIEARRRADTGSPGRR